MLQDFENLKLTIGPKHLDETIGFFEKHLPTKEPIGQFKKWLKEICEIPDLKYPAAMFLATVNPSGQVSNRTMLCRGYNKHGFLFYTDYLSPKAADLMQNPNAAATFYWGAANRSVRIEGVCEMFTDEEADHHFQNLSPEERLATKLGEQSAPYTDRFLLSSKYNGLKKQIIPGNQIKRPKFWGGFILHPHRVEFWEGRHNRLNDRINFKKMKEDCLDKNNAYSSGADNWIYERLIP